MVNFNVLKKNVKFISSAINLLQVYQGGTKVTCQRYELIARSLITRSTNLFQGCDRTGTGSRNI